MKTLVKILVVLSLQCCEPPKEILCESHCWSIQDCARENDPEHKVDRTLPMGECFTDCEERWNHSELKDAYGKHKKYNHDRELNRGVNGCKYLAYFARRYGEGAECIDGVVSVSVDGEIYDCYVR